MHLARSLLLVGLTTFVLAYCLTLARADEPETPGASAEAVASAASTFAPYKLQGLLGIAAVLGTCYVLSENRRQVSLRTVAGGLGLQCALGVLLLWVPAGRKVLEAAELFVENVLNCAITGSAFVFGDALTRPDGPAGFVFAFRVLPTIIFVAALFAVLYHLGIMQIIVRSCALVMARVMGASGAESLNTAASLFLGQTEAPLTIRPYLAGLTRSELLVVMVSGMALVSGGVLGAYLGAGASARDLLTAIVMSAAPAIFLSKIVIPETGRPETLGMIREDATRPDANLLDAAARGTREGLQLALNVAAMLISFLALIAVANLALNAAGGWLGFPDLSLQSLLGRAMAPVAWLMGVPWDDCQRVGGLMGTRAITNELIAYGELGPLKASLAPRSYEIATIALCGFANLSSIGIQIGGIGALVPERRQELAELGFKAFLIATLANILSASIAGILL